MAGLSTGLKQKLTISRCTTDEGVLKVGGPKFEVMLNPSGFTHQHSISYSNSDSKCDSGQSKKPKGKSAVEPKFDAYQSEKVNFDLVIDGTGVVSLPEPDVKTQIDKLKDIVYRYVGAEHEPSVVQLIWGECDIFYGRLDSMSVEYTLFKPSGTPLRAKVKLAFTSYMASKEEALRANSSSPDLTHTVEVKAGDTLPLLCYRIYKDSSYYTAVAKINHIVNFRGLTPGTRLRFPPLR